MRLNDNTSLFWPPRFRSLAQLKIPVLPFMQTGLHTTRPKSILTTTFVIFVMYLQFLIHEHMHLSYHGILLLNGSIRQISDAIPSHGLWYLPMPWTKQVSSCMLATNPKPLSMHHWIGMFGSGLSNRSRVHVAVQAVLAVMRIFW